MLEANHIQQLKQTNISVDGGKTKGRVEKLWKSATAEQKKTVLELADVIAATIYRVFRTGSISAKLAVPLAQALNRDPFYLTGEADEPGECTDALLRKLLLKHNYKNIVAEANLKRPYERRYEPAEEAESEVSLPLTPPLPPDSGALTADDLHLLLHALTIQAKAGIAAAKEKLAQIKLLLLA